MAFESQILTHDIDRRFYYEPMLTAHPEDNIGSFDFAGKKQLVPLWVSSMTGGTKLAGKINRNLARACHEFGMGMGLGSCRIILDDDQYFSDFDMRDIIGKDLPFFANLGIAQLEESLEKKELAKINRLIERLTADGLIIHVNPLQEWFQPEGDRLKRAPIDCISELIHKVDYPVIVKEVGQGMGYASLKALLELPLQAVEFAAFGGTNFAKLELMRSPETKRQLFEPLSKVGHDAFQMTDLINQVVEEGNVNTKQLIISGGIKTFLDGYYLIQKAKMPAIYGQASGFLKHAREDYEQLHEYVSYQVKGLQLAYSYLRINQ